MSRDELGCGAKLQAALLDKPCVDHDCRQGRDHEKPESLLVVAVGLVMLCAVAVLALIN